MQKKKRDAFQPQASSEAYGTKLKDNDSDEAGKWKCSGKLIGVNQRREFGFRGHCRRKHQENEAKGESKSSKQKNEGRKRGGEGAIILNETRPRRGQINALRSIKKGEREGMEKGTGKKK